MSTVSTAARPNAAVAPVPRRARRGAAEARAGLLLSVPFLLFFGTFTAWPIIQSLFMSFTDSRSRDLRTPFAVNLVGLDNYTKALSDPVYLKSALNTAIFVVVGMFAWTGNLMAVIAWAT